MLILTRTIDQKIVIGDKQIEVCVLGIKANQVKLGIRAAKHISVHREEIFNKLNGLEGNQNVQV